MSLGRKHKKQIADRLKKERADQAEKYQPIVDGFFKNAWAEVESCIKENRRFVSPTISVEVLTKARYCDTLLAAQFKKWLNNNGLNYHVVDLGDSVSLRLIEFK